MIKNKLKILFYSILLMASAILCYSTVKPLYEEKVVTDEIWQRMTQPSNLAIRNNSVVLRLSGDNFSEGFEAIKEKLAEIEGFLGVYLYPVTDIYVGQIEGVDIDPGNLLVYEFNNALLYHGMLSLTQGVLPDFEEELDSDNVLPVVVTENDVVKLGDSLRLKASLSSSYLEALVVGVVKDDFYLPFTSAYFNVAEYYKEDSRAVKIFTPSLSQYRAAIGKKPSVGKAYVYAVFEEQTDQVRADIEKSLKGLAVADTAELWRATGMDFEKLYSYTHDIDNISFLQKYAARLIIIEGFAIIACAAALTTEACVFIKSRKNKGSEPHRS